MAREQVEERSTARTNGRTRRSSTRQRNQRQEGGGPPPLRHGRQWSPSTLRALWVDSLDEHEQRKGQTLATQNHDVIRRWAEERGAVPAGVRGSEHDSLRGVLRFMFPGEGGEAKGRGRNSRLEPVEWDLWFDTFDARELAFLYQEHRRDGSVSNFFRFDSPHREDA